MINIFDISSILGLLFLPIGLIIIYKGDDKFSKLGKLILILGIVLTVLSIIFTDTRTFTEIFGRIKQDYVEPVSDKVLLESAIRGMLSGLDPHSSYLDSEEYKELKVGTTGRFGGLGIQVTMEA